MSKRIGTIETFSKREVAFWTTLVVVLALVLVYMFASIAWAAEKVTICHAAGREGTTQYVTLEVSENALNGHFDENGTPQAGHEQDYFGPCEEESSSTTQPPTTTTSTTIPSTTTTTGPEGSTTTSIPEESTTTTVTSDTPTTTAATSTSLPFDESETPTTVVLGTTEIRASTIVANREELPMTGLDPSLLLGSALALAASGAYLIRKGKDA